MSSETIVAVVSVFVAGVMGPTITAYATTRGQARKFDDLRERKDRDELRTLLTEGASAMGLVGENVEEFRTVYLTAGQDHSAYREVLRKAQVARRSIASARARIALRLGLDSDVIRACDRAIEHSDRALSPINLYVTLGPDVAEPKNSELETELHGISRARVDFIESGLEWIGAVKKTTPGDRGSS